MNLNGLIVNFLTERTMFESAEIFLVHSQYTIELPKNRSWGHFCLLFLSTTRATTYRMHQILCTLMIQCCMFPMKAKGKLKMM